MAWIIVFVAGLLEVVMALSLQQSDAFSRLLPSIGFLVFGSLSFYLLALSLRELPVGTAYAVWTGTGAVGTAILGILILGEPANVWRLSAIMLIVAGIAALKIAPGS